MLVFVGGAIYAQTAPPNAPQVVPRVTGAASPMGDVPAPALARPVIDDKRLMRNYPEQPPIIPHSIDELQLTLKTNRCLDCHRRQFTEGSGAPMISVTHFMDRNGQVLADVTPGATSAPPVTSSRRTRSRSFPHLQGHASRRSREEVRTCDAAAQVTPDLVLADRQPPQRASEPRLPCAGRLHLRRDVLGRLQHRA